MRAVRCGVRHDKFMVVQTGRGNCVLKTSFFDIRKWTRKTSVLSLTISDLDVMY